MKLSAISKQRNVAYKNVLTEFFLERLLARLISVKELSSALVFKGGYVGRRAYGSPRYTIDLDALLEGHTVSELRATIITREVTLSEVDISGALARAKELAASDRSLPSSVRSVLELLVLIIELLLRRGNISSRNSSVPPPQDPYRQRGKCAVIRGERKRKPGGQRP